MYLNQTDLGKLYGVSCKVIGDWLIEINLRTIDRKPSRKAFEEGFVSQAGLANGGYYYRWHKDKTVKALAEGGHHTKVPVSTGRIMGPFTARQRSENGYEIVGGNGTVSVWVMGKWNANSVTRLLNLGYEHGQFGGEQ